MDLIKLVDTLSEEMYLRLKFAVETGKWPEGTVVEQAQLESAMHIVMAYQSRILKSDEIMTIGADGEIVNKSKYELKKQFSSIDDQQKQQDANDIARFSNI
jgi:uncharacterized protein